MQGMKFVLYLHAVHEIRVDRALQMMVIFMPNLLQDFGLIPAKDYGKYEHD